MQAKSRKFKCAHETVKCSLRYAGCFLFVHIGLRLPRLRIGKCPTAFFVYIGFVIGRKPSFVINGKNKKDMPAFSSKQSCDLLENPLLAALPYNQEISGWTSLMVFFPSFMYINRFEMNEDREINRFG